MQYSHLLTFLAGAAAVSAQAGLTDGLLGSSLTGTASGSGSAQAKGALSGLPTDDLLEGGLTGNARKAASGSAQLASEDAASSDEDATGPFSEGGLLDSLQLKQLYKPDPYVERVTTTQAIYVPRPTVVTRTVTTSHHALPTVSPLPPVKPIDPPTGPGAAVVSCSEGTATSCCNTDSASDGLLSNILGGSCALSSLNIPVLAVGALSGSQCNNGNTFCCPINQNGNLNIALACIPLNL